MIGPLIGLVAADRAAGGGAENPVMAGKMAGDSTDGGTFEATSRRGGLRRGQRTAK